NHSSLGSGGDGAVTTAMTSLVLRENRRPYGRSYSVNCTGRVQTMREKVPRAKGDSSCRAPLSFPGGAWERGVAGRPLRVFYNPPMNICLFDIDGTLISSGGAGRAALEGAFADEFGVPLRTERLQYSGRTDRAIMRDLFHLHDLEESAD